MDPWTSNARSGLFIEDDLTGSLGTAAGHSRRHSAGGHDDARGFIAGHLAGALVELLHGDLYALGKRLEGVLESIGLDGELHGEGADLG
jgi:hypothetical protein